MRLLCAVGQRDGSQVVRETLACVGGGIDLVLLHVVDDRPWRDVEAFRGLLRRMSTEQQRELDAAEESAGRAALAEAEVAARGAGAQVTSITIRLERGKPEQVIFALAREVQANLIALRPRERPDGFPLVGPPSVGHTARCVVDHALCPVLLLRAMH